MKKTEEWLEQHKDLNNAEFFCRLAPEIDPGRVLGVRRKEVRDLARMLSEDERAFFLQEIPHKYIEEDMIHTELLNLLKDPLQARKELDRFKGQIHSWAITDSLTFPRLSDQDLLAMAQEFARDSSSYVRRLAILWIMKRALKPAKNAPGFADSMAAKAEKERTVFWIEQALAIPGDEKEVVVAKGWLLCEALIKTPDQAWPYFQSEQVDPAIRRIAIQKSIESLRISAAKKEELKMLRTSLKASASARADLSTR